MGLTIEQFLKEVQNQFKDIDNAISSLESREDELKESIEKSGNAYDIDVIKRTSSVRSELSQVQEALINARAKQSDMKAELGEKLGTELHILTEGFRSDKRAEHQELTDEITRKALELEESVRAFSKLNYAARTEYTNIVNQLRPYTDKRGNDVIDINRPMYGSGILRTPENDTVKFIMKGIR